MSKNNPMSRYNRIKVIAADLDGTLTDSMKHVMPYTIQIMQKAAAQGCLPAETDGVSAI